ncbi:MAG: 3'-5' exonuclease, partial [Tannerella sp.]|nr:3'-5' exonuclease [Tannerella sp.]
MYLFFDTETTGLPKNWKAPVTNVDNWPRLVQLAFLTYDNSGEKIAAGDFIIKPIGFVIPSDISKVHGITTERA